MQRRYTRNIGDVDFRSESRNTTHTQVGLRKASAQQVGTIGVGVGPSVGLWIKDVVVVWQQ